MSRARFVEALKELVEAQYPEVLFMEAPEPEIPPGSPMSQLGDVTESESLGEPDADIASEAAADVSMAERSMSDILASINHLCCKTHSLHSIKPRRATDRDVLW